MKFHACLSANIDLTFCHPIEPFVPYFIRLVATICDSTTLVYNRTVYTQEGVKAKYLEF